MTKELLFISMPGGAEWIMIIIGLAIMIYWIRAIIEVAGSRFESSNIKVLWLAVVVFLGVLGAFIYNIAGRQNRIRVQ